MGAFLAGWYENFRKELKSGWPILVIALIIGVLPVSAGWRVLIEALFAVILVALVAWAIRSTSPDRATRASRDQSDTGR